MIRAKLPGSNSGTTRQAMAKHAQPKTTWCKAVTTASTTARCSSQPIFLRSLPTLNRATTPTQTSAKTISSCSKAVHRVILPIHSTTLIWSCLFTTARETEKYFWSTTKPLAKAKWSPASISQPCTKKSEVALCRWFRPWPASVTKTSSPLKSTGSSPITSYLSRWRLLTPSPSGSLFASRTSHPTKFYLSSTKLSKLLTTFTLSITFTEMCTQAGFNSSKVAWSSLTQWGYPTRLKSYWSAAISVAMSTTRPLSSFWKRVFLVKRSTFGPLDAAFTTSSTSATPLKAKTPKWSSTRSLTSTWSRRAKQKTVLMPKPLQSDSWSKPVLTIKTWLGHPARNFCKPLPKLSPTRKPQIAPNVLKAKWVASSRQASLTRVLV